METNLSPRQAVRPRQSWPAPSTIARRAIVVAAVVFVSAFLFLPRVAGAGVIPHLPTASHQSSQVITDPSATYTIDLGGTLDGRITRREQGYQLPWVESFQPNVHVSITNLGRETIETPWVSVDGRGDWLTAEDVVLDAVLPGMTDRDRALSAWAFMRANQYRVDHAWGPQYYPIAVSLNAFGYGECSTTAHLLGQIVEAAGGVATVFGSEYHWVTEAWWDGRPHLIDADRASFYVRAPGGDPASCEDLIADHDMGRRMHRGGAAAPDDPALDSLLTVFWDASWQQQSLGGTEPRDMNYSLRPGETLYRSWRNWGKHTSYGIGEGVTPPSRYGNGYLDYRPDLADTLFLRDAQSVTGLTSSARDGLRPNLHPAESGAGSMVIRMASPYVFVGGSIELGWSCPGATDRVTASVSRNGVSWTPVWEAPGAGDGVAQVSLDDWIDPHDTAYLWAAYLRIDIEADAGNPPGVLPGLDSIDIVMDVQVAPNALPELWLGTNTVSYRDAHDGERLVQVAFGWDESSANRPPLAPSTLEPPAGATGVSTRPTFTWVSSGDPDGDAIIDYHLQVSERADFRWPVTPNFDRYLSRTAFAGHTQWSPPADGLLPAGGRYYWRVRAMDADSAWSPWSTAGPFDVGGPAPPESLAVDVRGHEITLAWQPDNGTPTPVAWRVYGSNEQGFACTSANQLAEVTGTTCLVTSAFPTQTAQNRCFYRVIGVDGGGRLSAPSASIGLPAPALRSVPPTAAITGAPYQYVPDALAARRFDQVPHDDVLTWTPITLPDWLQHTAPALFEGTPAVPGTWPVSLRVTNQAGREAEQWFAVRTGSPGEFSGSIALKSGYTLVSWPIDPGATDPETILASALDHLDYAMTWDGDELYFRPGAGDTSSLRALDTRHAYWLVMNEPDTLILSGNIVEPGAVSIDLQPGWNLVPYLPFAADSVSHALAALGANLLAALGLGESGEVQVYDPVLAEPSTLSVLRPDHGYWIQVALADTLRYPGDTVCPELFGAGNLSRNERAMAPQSLYWAALYGEDITAESEHVTKGSSVFVYDPQGVECGQTEIDAPGEFHFTPVWGDDPATPEDEGASPGDSLIVVVKGMVLQGRVVYMGMGARLRASGPAGARTSTPNMPGSGEPGEGGMAGNAIAPGFVAVSPARTGSEFRFLVTVPEPGDGVIDVYSPAGRRMATIAIPRLARGVNQVRWVAQAAGRPLAAGVYFAAFSDPARPASRLTTKFVLVR